MTVRLKINGVEYTAINAAEESTLQDILNAMQGQTSAAQQQAKAISKNQQNQAVNTQQSNQALGNFSQAARRTENTLEDLERSADQAGGTLKATAKEVYTGFSSAVKSIGSSLSSGELKVGDLISGIGNAAAAGLDKLTTGVGTGIGSLFGGPVGAVIGNQIGSAIGGVAGDALVLFTGALTTAIGIMEGFAETTRTLANEGIIFGEGIGTATDEILGSGLTLSQYTKLVQESGDSLRILGGSAGQGSKRFLSMYKALDANKNEFLNLGFAIEDLPSLMADYTASLERFSATTTGLTDEQLRQNTLEYAKNLRVLADLTGEDVKAAKDRKKAVMEEAQLQNVIIGLSKSGVKDASDRVTATIALMEKMGLSNEAAIEYINRGVVTGNDALFASSNGVREALAELRTRLLSTDANVGINDFTQALVQTVKDNAPIIKSSIENSLAPIAALGGDKVAAITERIGIAYRFLDGVENLDVKELYENANEASKTSDALQKGITQLTISQNEINKAMQGLAEELTTSASTVISPAIDQLAQAISSGANTIKTILKDPKQFMADYNPFALSDEEKVEYEQSEEFKEIKKIVDSLSPGQSLQSETGQAMLNEYAKVIQYLESFDAETRAKKMEELNLTEEKLATDKMTDWLFGLFGSESDVKSYVKKSSPDTVDSTESTIKTKAYGDIMNPKPGGHIVRVAEAGQPEIIAPATRGADGKLGLEVSGVMLDSSRLLQSLLKVNEGQAALMAGLNDKINNMSGHMENLVSAQRQANRLAV